MSEIEAIALFPSIGDDGRAEFLALAAKAVELVGAEAGTLRYDWSFDPDERSCIVQERYASSEAVLAHLANVGPMLGRLIELGGGVQLQVVGEPSEELRAAVAALQPAVYRRRLGK